MRWDASLLNQKNASSLVGRYSFLILLMALMAGCGSSKDAQKSKQEKQEDPVKGQSDAEPYTPDWYIDEYKGFAIEEMKRTGIPASITLAQGMLESSYGKSKLSKKGKNHFGIKCHRGEWGGGKMFLEDDAPDECFRTYESVLHSYKDHSQFLKGSSRYDFLFEYKPTAYKKWAKGLQKAGYATNPNYSKILIRLVDRYDLHYYDQFHDEPYKQKETNEKQIADQSDKEETEELPEGVFKRNGLKATEVRKGETLQDIARKHDLSKQDLRAYNDLPREDHLQEKMLLYLEPKQNKTDISYHVVEKGETLHSISQQYGIKLDKLYKRNRLKKGQQPAVNERLFLRERRYSKPKVRQADQKTNKPVDEKEQQPTQQTSSESKKEGKKDEPTMHSVKAGETMQDIANQYKIDLKTLYKRNRMEEGEQPAKGAKVHLKTRRYVSPELRKNSGESGEKSDGVQAVKNGQSQQEKPSRKQTNASKEPSLQKKTRQKSQKKEHPVEKSEDDQSAKSKKRNNVKTNNQGKKSKSNKGKADDDPQINKTNDKASQKVTSHTVKSGESLYSIAQKYQVSITQIKEWNGLESNDLKVGQKLQVRAPDKDNNQPESQPKSATDSIPSYHEVASGETLYRISKKYQIPVSRLKSLNELNEDALDVGQKLQLKKLSEGNKGKAGNDGEKEVKIHKVEAGDTLYSIAKQYDLSVSKLKTANELDGSSLQPGQKLEIPAP